jgi:peptide/nickel transport system substrate-binding protein
LARPKPSSPSPRVYAAFAIAAIIGATVFTIWWLTSDARLRQSSSSVEKPTAAKPSVEEIIEAGLPRGGSLSGSTDATELAIERLTGASLVRVNRSTDQVEPRLAESWTASPDNLIYTVTLRPGLVTSEGIAFNAADAAKALNAVSALGKPVAIRALDPRTLEIRFHTPFAPALRVLDRYSIAGMGPFVAEAQDKNPPDTNPTAARTFRRNPRYWRKAADGAPLPYLDEIVLTSADARVGADFADSAIRAEDFEALKRLEQSGKLRLFELGPGLDADAVWFSPSPPRAEERPWLTSDALRVAISTAVDRREYCKQVFYGACDPMAGPVSPANVAWFNPDVPLGQANPQLARAKLAELGLRDRTGDGFLDDATRRALRFSLLIRRDVPSSARAAAFLAATLKAIGVQVDITPVDAATLAARRKNGNYDAIYGRIEVRDTDPAMNLDFWLSSGEGHIWNPGRTRVADWERQIDQLMMKNATTFDRIERLQAFVDAQKIYLQHLPAIFFGAPHVRVTTSMRVLNATPSPLRPHLLWNAENLAALK